MTGERESDEKKAREGEKRKWFTRMKNYYSRERRISYSLQMLTLRVKGKLVWIWEHIEYITRHDT